MRINLRENHYDLYAILISSTVFLVIVLIFPEAELLRYLFGIPFLMLFPGYALTSILFPKKYKKIEPEDKRKEKRRRIPALSRNKLFSGRSHERSLERTEDKENIEQDQGNIRETGIDWPLRLATSVGLSIACVVIIGFLLNELHPLDPDLFQITFWPLLIANFSAVFILTVIALWRRDRQPPDKRFQVAIYLRSPFEKERSDIIITSVLIVLILAASISGIYFYKTRNEKERFTEFYLLGSDGEIGDYPRYIYTNESETLFLGVRNHEFREENYEIRIMLGAGGFRLSTSNFFNLTIRTGLMYSKDIRLSPDEEYMEPISFRIKDSGNFNLNMHLIKNGDIYRKIFLRLSVFKKEDMYRSDDRNLSVFIIGPEGTPSTTNVYQIYSQPVTFEAFADYKSDRRISFNVSVSIGQNIGSWIDVTDSQNTTVLDRENGAYHFQYLTEEGEYKVPFHLQLPKGPSELKVDINKGFWNLTFRKQLWVY